MTHDENEMTDTEREAFDEAVREWEQSPMRGRLKYLERNEAGELAQWPYGDGT